MPCRYRVVTWATSLIILFIITSTPLVGAKDSTKDPDKGEAASRRIEAMLLRLLEQNRALRGQVEELKAENASFRSSRWTSWGGSMQ